MQTNSSLFTCCLFRIPFRRHPHRQGVCWSSWTLGSRASESFCLCGKLSSVRATMSGAAKAHFNGCRYFIKQCSLVTACCSQMDVLFHFTNKLSHTICLKGTAVMTARGALFPIFYLILHSGSIKYRLQPLFSFWF